MLLRLACLTVTNAFAVLGLLSVSDRDWDSEILVWRHQVAVLERQLGGKKVCFTRPDRVLLAALLYRLRPQARRRIRVLGATANPAASWVTRAARNLVMGLRDAGCGARFLIRDRDGKFPGLFDAVPADAGITVVRSGVRVPRMNATMERWVQSCRRELLDRTLVWDQHRLLRALREFEAFYSHHRPHQGIANAGPPRPLPPPITDLDQIGHLGIRRQQRLGGILNEYDHAA